MATPTGVTMAKKKRAGNWKARANDRRAGERPRLGALRRWGKVIDLRHATIPFSRPDHSGFFYKCSIAAAFAEV